MMVKPTGEAKRLKEATAHAREWDVKGTKIRWEAMLCERLDRIVQLLEEERGYAYAQYFQGKEVPYLHE